ncbi:Tetratricopeptide repeat-containing protein [Sediminibacterium ginsengisoli]|uniref:Tetratricopeptide repeat-containing protein n=2 Tax=Sediminibacterium ginsengisoli TaxID=413434 RepID=A0A1T4K8N7_9BACT|nr:Tetratricopeptide repeat-containing protein [Sediminibacterium ginsengisoli]
MRSWMLLFLMIGYLCPLKAQDAEQLCIRYTRQGGDYLAEFRAQEALSVYRKALSYAYETGSNFYIGSALKGMGQAIWYQGIFKEAADTMESSLHYLRKQDQAWQTATSLRLLSNIYDELGNYEKAFAAVTEALELYKTVSDRQNMLLSIVQMGVLYKNIGDYAMSLELLRKAAALHPSRGNYDYREMNTRFGDLYMAMKQPDVALSFYRNARYGSPSNMRIYLKFGDYFLFKNQLDSAYYYYHDVYLNAKDSSKNINHKMSALLGLSNVYYNRNRLDEALQTATEALHDGDLKGTRQHRQNAHFLLSKIYSTQGNTTLAFEHYKQYEQLKDSISSDQFKGHLYTFKQKNDLEKRADELRFLKQQRNFLIGSIAIISVLGISIFFIIALRHKNEKLQLQHRSAELEMQALRAQMNPHFIFNCLSAINHFIVKNETDLASDYLTRFSRLIRQVLAHSGKSIITLEEELSMLKLYLDMEQLRFKDAFDYYIHYDAGIQPSMVSVPSLLLQPFCENAIWHGLLHQSRKGKLTIDFSLYKNTLICKITDNGIGREKAAAMKTHAEEKQGSYGLKLTAERLALYNGSKYSADDFSMADVHDKDGNIAGTVVILKIRNQFSDDQDNNH